MAVLDSYIRVSRIELDDAAISPDIQANKIRWWIEGQSGVTLGKLESDLNVSGGLAPSDRKLGALLERCRTGKSDGLLVYRLDRLSRDQVDILTITRDLKSWGKRLVCVEDNFDSDARDGKLTLSVMAMIAEWQRERSREDWHNSREDWKRRGGYLAGHAPTGYKRVAGGKLVPDPTAKRAIVEAFRMRAGGASFPSIADALSAAGVLPSAGNRRGNANRVRWSREGVRQLLRNPIYRGAPRGDNEGTVVTALVTEDEWYAAQLPAPVSRGTRKPRGMLLGLIRCGSCGHLLHVSGGDHDTRSYACRGKFAEGICSARPAARVAAVDEYVRELLILNEDRLLGSLERLAERHHDATLAAEEANTDLRNFITTASAIDVDLFEAGLRARQRRAGDAEQRLRDLPEPGDWPLVGQVAGGKTFVVPASAALTVEEQRQYARAYISEVVLMKSPIRGRHAPAVSERIRVRLVGDDDFFDFA